MENKLQKQTEVNQNMMVEPQRTTRGVNNSAKYADLLSKSGKETALRNSNIVMEPVSNEVT